MITSDCALTTFIDIALRRSSGALLSAHEHNDINIHEWATVRKSGDYYTGPQLEYSGDTLYL